MTITATSHNGISAQCNVVVAKKPTSIKLNSTKLPLTYDAATGTGSGFQLVPTLSADSASRITYVSSNASVVHVDADGMLTAVGCGTAKITASTFNSKKATCTLTVMPAP